MSHPTHTTPDGNPSAPTPVATPARATPARLPHGCGGCDNRWSGNRTTHCATCHRTFSGVATFDAHHPGQCRDPRDLGMTLVAGRAYDCWGTTGEDTDHG